MPDPVESRGWPFSDCAIHVQFRGDDNKRFSIDDIFQECESFGRVLKIYTWTAKRSQKPQACVLFDSVNAVGLAERSTHANVCRLWKTGYHMLRMCESTILILRKRLQEDGLTRDHPMFATIPVKLASYPAHPPERGIKSSEKASRPIPTGPRYKPYSLEPHRGKSPVPFSSAPPEKQPSNSPYISFPPKRDTFSPKSPSRSYSTRRPSFDSPNRPTLTSQNVKPSSPPPSPPKPAVFAPSHSSRAGSPHLAHVNGLQQTQINRKLQTDIQELVSAQIDWVAKVHEAEEENQRLKTRLRTYQDDIALLEDTVKRVEGREQAVIALLSDTEAVHNATKRAYARDQEEMMSLKNSYRAVESAKIKLETELVELRAKYEALESLGAQEPPRRSHHRSGELPLDSDLSWPGAEDSRSVERDKAFAAPAKAVDSALQAGLDKRSLQNLPSLLCAFRDIDDLVRSAFRA